MKTILVNIKTTLVGVGGILGGAAAIVNALADGWQSPDLDVIQASWPAILAGVGLLFARDGDKSSQDSGIR